MDKDEERAKIIKTLIGGGILALIIIIGASIYNYYFKDDGANASSKYLILGNYSIWKKTNNSFKQIKELNDDILNLEYSITDGITKKDNVNLQFNDNKWYFFDKDYNQVDMDNFRVAMHDVNVTLADYEKESVIPSDDEYVVQFLKDNNIINISGYRVLKVTYDFDNDGTEESLYTLGNNSLSAIDSNIKGFIFAVKNDEITKINEVNNGPFWLMDILDFDNDGNFEVLVSKRVLDIPTFDSCYQWYGVVNNKWELKKDCK